MEKRGIVLLGKTGSGKSASGNTILNGTRFEAKFSPLPVTNQCYMNDVKDIRVIDTPGRLMTSLTSNELKQLMIDCVGMSSPGPHAFLLVIKLGRFTKEEKDVLEWIKKYFGEDAIRHTIVLITHTDQLGEQTLEGFLEKSQELKQLVNSCGRRYLAFNNSDPSRDQVDKLMQMVDDMVRSNGGNYYTINIDTKFEKNEIIGIAALVGVLAAVGICAFVASKQ